jgi:hypothetical protein
VASPDGGQPGCDGMKLALLLGGALWLPADEVIE